VRAALALRAALAEHGLVAVAAPPLAALQQSHDVGQRLAQVLVVDVGHDAEGRVQGDRERSAGFFSTARRIIFRDPAELSSMVQAVVHARASLPYVITWHPRVIHQPADYPGARENFPAGASSI